MFGVGMGELVVIAIIALLFLGPEKLPDAAKAIGKGIRDFRRHTRDLQETLEQDTELGEAVRDLRSALTGDEPRMRKMQPKPIPKPPAAKPETPPSPDAPKAPDALAPVTPAGEAAAPGAAAAETTPVAEPAAGSPAADDPRDAPAEAAAPGESSAHG